MELRKVNAGSYVVIVEGKEVGRVTKRKSTWVARLMDMRTLKGFCTTREQAIELVLKENEVLN